MRLRGLVLASLAGLAIAEAIRPLRKRTAPRLPRTIANLALGAMTASLPASKRHRGKFADRRILNVLLLDYSLWWWHRANHEVPFLWRFHRVHHTDRDLDVSTALRFHPGEMVLAALFRELQLRLFGSDAVDTWQLMLLPSILFHHSNTRLSRRADRKLSRVLVTPRMHGIHHSQKLDETDSNYASLFTFWDVLHGTLRLDVAQDEIEIGAPDQPSDVSFVKLLTMPFEPPPTSLPRSTPPRPTS